jgi:2-succinyl-6-hydroxy-2,4-cyclohexadiene-1-carboxylate synthase
VPTVVLLHGFTHTGASWDRVAAALGERYRVVAPDIRGHGSAAAAAPVTVEVVIDDVARAGGGRFVLAGYSMGGRIALHVALAMPDRVSRLVMIGTTPGIEDPLAREARRSADNQLAEEIMAVGMEEFARRWEGNPVLAGQPRSVAEAARADRLRNAPDGLARALRVLGTGAMPPAWHCLGDLSMPVTIIAGERDEKYVEIGARMTTEIPAAELVVIPGTGHAVHLEAPERVASLIAGAS